jgi:phage gp29-like protein
MLVDIYGQPLTSEPKEMQTHDDRAQIAGLYQHFSDHPSRGLTPTKLAGIMAEAERGNLISQCELAEDMEEKDGHIFSELQKRRRALLGLDWQIVPPRNASKAELADVAMLSELMEDRTDIENIVFNMSDGVLKSFANQELEWQTIEKMRIPQCHWRDPAWFQTNPNDRNELRLRDGSYEGAELQPFGWISHKHGAKSGYVGRSALARVLAWPYLFKNFSVRDLAEFLEIYGLPLRLGKYPTGASEKEKATLLRAVMSIGHNAGGIIPRGMDIEFQEAAKGSSTPFEAMMAWCEKTQSKAILGGTLTSQADGASSTNALGNVHNEVRQELRDSDAKQIAATLTRDLIYPMYALNGRSFSGPHRIPRFEFDLSEPEDIAYYAQHLPSLVTLGMQIPVSWVTEKLQIPEPENGEAVLGVQPTEPTKKKPESEEEQVSLAALKSGLAHSDQDNLDQALEELTKGNLSESLADTVAPLLALAASAPDDLEAKLQTLWPEMDSDALADRLAKIFFVAELWGMTNA